MYSITRAADLKIAAFGVRAMCKAGKPADGNGDSTTILQINRERVVRNRYIQNSS